MKLNRTTEIVLIDGNPPATLAHIPTLANKSLILLGPLPLKTHIDQPAKMLLMPRMRHFNLFHIVPLSKLTSLRLSTEQQQCQGPEK
jgi:hypothetical protein